MTEWRRYLRYICGISTVYLAVGSLAASTMGAKASALSLAELMTTCLTSVRTSSEPSFPELELEATGAGNGAVSGNVNLPSGAITLTFHADSDAFGTFCGLWGHGDTVSDVTLSWGTAEDDVRTWFFERLQSGGFVDATNPDEPGLAAFQCAQQGPYVWFDVQPVFALFQPIDAQPDFLRVEDQPMRFFAHQLTDEMCAANIARNEEMR